MFAFKRYIYNIPINIKRISGTSLRFLQETAIKDQPDEEIIDKIVYNSILESKKLNFIEKKVLLKKLSKNVDTSPPIPVSLKYLNKEDNEDNIEKPSNISENNKETQKNIYFPFQKVDNLIGSCSKNIFKRIIKNKAESAEDEIRLRKEFKNELSTWMTAYDNYDDSILEDSVNLDWVVNYGTPNPESEISDIPCGGCGACLHCKDTSLPGYIPSEIFYNTSEKGCVNLEGIICQRCYFLKNFNVALQMRVSFDNYPKVLSTIGESNGMVVLIVDLLDFPCSIWPGIADLCSHKTPIIIVGNKVDLLPQDNKYYLKKIKKILFDNVKLYGFATSNIKHVALISAKTGYGIDDLITVINSHYEKIGDLFLVGCTNVGKSSLFNAFLQSDLCKSQAVDLIQRATISVWPGTTLNLLKFPVKRPVGFRQHLRHQRLLLQKTEMEQENILRKEQLKTTKDPKFATLIGHYKITENPFNKDMRENDVFQSKGHPHETGMIEMGINENSKEYVYGKWCYDTPGVVHPEQIIHLLTTEELLLVLPKELIIPRTYCIKPEHTLFIGGLSRLDYIEGPSSILMTVFSSEKLPITVCKLKDATYLYKELLTTNLLKAPKNNLERLSKWPGLELAKKFNLIGLDYKISCSDVVLSSSGWISITGHPQKEYKFQAWTPQKKGVFIRDCLLPNAVALKGDRISHSIAYKKHRFYLNK